MPRKKPPRHPWPPTRSTTEATKQPWGHCKRCGREGTVTDDLRADDAQCKGCQPKPQAPNRRHVADLVIEIDIKTDDVFIVFRDENTRVEFARLTPQAGGYWEAVALPKGGRIVAPYDPTAPSDFFPYFGLAFGYVASMFVDHSLKLGGFFTWEDPTCGGCQVARELRASGQPGACADHEGPRPS